MVLFGHPFSVLWGAVESFRDAWNLGAGGWMGGWGWCFKVVFTDVLNEILTLGAPESGLKGFGRGALSHELERSLVFSGTVWAHLMC